MINGTIQSTSEGNTEPNERRGLGAYLAAMHGMLEWNHTRRFWSHALAIRESASLRILPNVLLFGLIGVAVYAVNSIFRWCDCSLEIGPHEVAGALLGLLLVLRTNAGYDRWWEARKLWGGIVNQSRNLVLDALAYGPADREWRRQIACWTAAFSHVSRASLRGESQVPELVELVGRQNTSLVERSAHMPNYVAYRIGALVEQARRDGTLSEFAFLEINRQKAQLIDHVGACERILKTPLALVYSIKISRFVFLFLATLPFALLHKLENEWLMPIVTMLVAYLVLGLDQIGIELQNPFARTSLSHLPLNRICETIQQDTLALLAADAPNDAGISQISAPVHAAHGANLPHSSHSAAARDTGLLHDLPHLSWGRNPAVATPSA